MPIKIMMTMPAMSTGRRPEKAKAAMARSVLEGTWLMMIKMGTRTMMTMATSMMAMQWLMCHSRDFQPFLVQILPGPRYAG